MVSAAVTSSTFPIQHKEISSMRHMHHFFRRLFHLGRCHRVFVVALVGLSASVAQACCGGKVVPPAPVSVVVPAPSTVSVMAPAPAIVSAPAPVSVFVPPPVVQTQTVMQQQTVMVPTT